MLFCLHSVSLVVAVFVRWCFTLRSECLLRSGRTIGPSHDVRKKSCGCESRSRSQLMNSEHSASAAPSPTLAVHFGIVTRRLCNSGAAICHTLLRVTIIHRLVEEKKKKKCHRTGTYGLVFPAAGSVSSRKRSPRFLWGRGLRT